MPREAARSPRNRICRRNWSRIIPILRIEQLKSRQLWHGGRFIFSVLLSLLLGQCSGTSINLSPLISLFDSAPSSLQPFKRQLYRVLDSCLPPCHCRALAWKTPLYQELTWLSHAHIPRTIDSTIIIAPWVSGRSGLRSTVCPRVHRHFEPHHFSLIWCHIPKSFWSLNGHTCGFSLVYVTHWCNTYTLGNRPQQIDLF